LLSNEHVRTTRKLLDATKQLRDYAERFNVAWSAWAGSGSSNYGKD